MINIGGAVKRLTIWFLVLNLSLVYLTFGGGVEKAKANDIRPDNHNTILSDGSMTGNIELKVDSKNHIVLSSTNITTRTPKGYEEKVGYRTFTPMYNYFVSKSNNKRAQFEPPGLNPINTEYIITKNKNFQNYVDLESNSNENVTYTIYLLVYRPPVNDSDNSVHMFFIGSISATYTVGLGTVTSDSLTLLEPVVIKTGLDPLPASSGNETGAEVIFKHILTGKSFGYDKNNICYLKINNLSDDLKSVGETYMVDKNDSCKINSVELSTSPRITVNLQVGTEASKKDNNFYSELQYIKPDTNEKVLLKTEVRKITVFKDSQGKIVTDVSDEGTSLEQLEKATSAASEKDPEQCLGNDSTFNFFKKGLCAVMTMIIDVAIGVSAWAFGYLQGAINGL